jgi:hypothetical protein
MRFNMMNCKPMVTPIETNMNNMSDFTAYSNLVNPMMYK